MLLGGWCTDTDSARHRRAVYFSLGLGVVWLFGIGGLTLDEYLHVGTFAE